MLQCCLSAKVVITCLQVKPGVLVLILLTPLLASFWTAFLVEELLSHKVQTLGASSNARECRSSMPLLLAAVTHSSSRCSARLATTLMRPHRRA